MPFSLNIPRTAATGLEILLDVGQSLYLLGANGTGKSSLMHRFYVAHAAQARRLSAHRQTSLPSDSLMMSPHDRRNVQQNIRSQDANHESRWREWNPEVRTSVAIYDLIEAENVRARGIAKAVDADDLVLAQMLSSKDAPITTINKLLRLAGLPIEISVHQNEQVLASKSAGPQFSITRLSDGERNALLVAAAVLTAPAGTLILVDEPERHLHRSIISPLLTALFDERADCAFIVSTHEVMLPLDNPIATTVLVRSCVYTNDQVSSWDIDVVSPAGVIDEQVKIDILGARKKILFVEGQGHSLDKQLYAVVFPEFSVIAKASCRDVEQAVLGIRGASDLHWLQAIGIVDNDGRTPANIASLRARGVYALSVHSVESIYYHPNIIHRTAMRLAGVTGEDASTRLETAKQSALGAIAEHAKRLAERAIENTLREELQRQCPGQPEIAAGATLNIVIDIKARVDQERHVLEGYLASGDLSGLIQRYPIRETPALERIARDVGYQGRRQYETAVRRCLIEEPETLQFVRTLFGELQQDIANAA